MFHTLVEFEKQWRVEVVGRYLRLRRRALTERHEHMRMLVVGQHDSHRPFDVRQARIEQRPAHPGGIHDVAVAQQDQRVDTVVGHRRVQTRTALAVHTRPVRFVRNAKDGCICRRKGGHLDTQEFLDVSADDLGGVLRPNRFDDRCERLLRVTECALVVRVVR